MTSTQLSYRRPNSAFRQTFGTTRRNSKPKDETTLFRESVYQTWNISGTKNPAAFRP